MPPVQFTEEPRPRVIYLHGFNSSPASLKARQFVDFCQLHNIESAVPMLSHDPAVAMQAALSCITQQTTAPTLLIGSSLGGYYATWLTEQFGIKSALVNPAVSPCDSLRTEFLGPQRNYYSGEQYDFTLEHVESLRKFDVKQVRDVKNYLLLVQTGDEVLDYRQAIARYEGCQQVVLQGGNHSFEKFEDYLPRIMQFAGLVE